MGFCETRLEELLEEEVTALVGRGKSERRPLVALTIGGREPTLDALEAGRYPLHKPLFIVTRAEPPADARRFVDFVLSDAGQSLLEAHGHLPRRRFAR